ncbi:MAG: hypothetical protein HKN82_17415 [Akkermansiaceae bacterium]|nr:hypothetical protein [Akkermansiaceae bacterium]NNM28239.1 hypothetical protein [Akkermansiaceae bacterium]
MQPIDELPYLLKLLDDEDPVVSQKVEERFAILEGDISRELATLGIEVVSEQRRRLSHLLAPGRRRQIRREWQVPLHGLDAPSGDWTSFEFLLRLLCELLHDGTTMRDPLPDALDQVADQAVLQEAHLDETSLCEFLFGTGRFGPNSQGFYQPENADLLWILTHRRGNPIGLAVVAMLVAHRLDLCITGCNFPGHFLAWIGEGDEALLVDCYHRGRLISLNELRTSTGVLSPAASAAIRQPCSLRTILVRILANLHHSFSQAQAGEDADLIQELLESLQTAE